MLALLKAGAKANVTSKFGATALSEAIKLGDMTMFRALLDAGADIESPNLDNQTALMLAISSNQPEMAKILIERGANVKAIETFRDQTALMWAAGANPTQPEIVDLLLAKGAASQVNLRAKFDDWERTQTSEPRAQFGSRHTGGTTKPGWRSVGRQYWSGVGECQVRIHALEPRQRRRRRSEEIAGHEMFTTVGNTGMPAD